MARQRVRPNTVAAQTKRATLYPPASKRRVGPPPTQRSVADRLVILEKDGESHKYKLLDGIDTFIYYVIERHKVYERRYAGKPGPWTDDEIMQVARFTNNFRILDYDTQFVIHVVIRVGLPDFKECVFRVLLFRLFDRVETYQYLCDQFGTPTWESFKRQAYLKALNKRKAAGYSLVGHAYQMPSPSGKVIGGASHHDRLLRLLELMMHTGFAEDISECYELCDVQTIIALYPTMGGFLGYQVILDLNMIPKLSLPEDWALPGPGAESGLRMIFGKQLKPDHIGLALSWVHEHFNELAFASRYSKKDIPALKLSTPGLSIVDIEHVLCEYSKYAKIASPKKYTYRKYDLDVARADVTRHLPLKWKPTLIAFTERNSMYTSPDADKNGEYVPLAILDKGLVDGKLHYKVRWEGWAPDADTWEPVAMLKASAPDVVNTFEKKLAMIEDYLKKYRTNKI